MNIHQLEKRQQVIETAIDELKRLAEDIDHEEEPPKNSRLNQWMIKSKLNSKAEHQQVKSQLAQKGYYIE